MTKLENTNSNSSLQEEHIDISELISLLWKDKKLIITIASVFFLATVIYTLTLQDIYKSTASMSVVESAGGGGGSVFTGLGGMGLGMAEFGVKGQIGRAHV